ncbi:hypothetical protein O6H91_18G046300 [Diphasiastrum complanatum]|uniref:Uncharacterized protein n=1 Tax=Diphasiastrum complanatum TaxID=34168 RepID=A0ACC2B0L6_DIPCM|nr:hypothetical protein O6H91_18G046300 [Diphasiastrum complanatum]
MGMSPITRRLLASRTLVSLSQIARISLFVPGCRRTLTEVSSGSPSTDSREDESPVISVDRSDLCRVKEHSHYGASREESTLSKHIRSLIQFGGGPITVAHYMEEVLTNPQAGFYVQQDAFGAGGSFITSPDISQMFGEMVGVWSMCLWQQIGQPNHFNLVELGPGRGTLMADLLRGTAKFTDFSKALSVHLVECSPSLRKLQYKALQCSSRKEVLLPGAAHDANENFEITKISGAPVSWHLELAQVPRGVPTIIIAHEFYDTLPIHQFQKTSRGWCEKLVDLAEDPSEEFRFVLSPRPTSACNMFLAKRLKWSSMEERQKYTDIEVCPGALKLAHDIAKRVGEDGGGALIIDYGEDGIISDSLQAIKKHQFVKVLEEPGAADLSAYVDFAAVKHTVIEAAAGASAYGPISQSQFLGQLGINFRLEALLKNASEEQAEALQEGYWRLVGDGVAPWLEEDDNSKPSVTGMGNRYKALAIVDTKVGPPICFD